MDYQVVRATPKETLDRLLGALAADRSVTAVYAGGSLARGVLDEVSDLDLWIESDHWSPESISSLLLTGESKQMNGMPFFHGVSVGGTILDILYGPKVREDYVKLELPEPRQIALQALPRCGLVEEFWMMSLKHRKNLWRGRYEILSYALHHDRRYLLRAWTFEGTGVDPGDQVFTLFALKTVYERFVDSSRLELLGLPLRNLDEILFAVQRYRDEMTSLFPNITLLEATVRSLPLTKS